MRLPCGYGGIIKLSGKRRRPYAVRITTGFDDDGKQQYKYVDYFATRKAALACLDEYNQRPYNLDLRNITFADIYKKWCDWRYLSHDKKVPNSYTSAYKWCHELYDKVFIDIRTADIQAVIDDCPKGWSTKKNIKIFIGLLYQYCPEIDIITTNYTQNVKLPEQEESTVHKPFTPKEIRTLWQHKDDEAVCLALILIYTGMRPTELLRIKTENVHLNDRYMMGGMKTTAGKNRVIPIADKIFPLVENLYDPANEYLVIDREDGKPVRTYDRFRWHYWEKSQTLKAMNHLPHDGRHTCATVLDNMGVNEKVRQLILGHASKNITNKVYTHKTIKQLKDAINLI